MVAEASNAPSRRDRKTAPRVPAGLRSMAALFARLNEADLCEIASQAIEELDRRSPDADAELNGDETDHNGSEEDFVHHGLNCLEHPGCPIADPDMGVDDDGEATNEDGEDETYTILPEYAGDQSTGPINVHQAQRHRQFEILRGVA